MGQLAVAILAGGSGTRLWPLSTPAHPKPFVALGPVGTLYEEAVTRAVRLGAAATLTIGPPQYRKLAAGKGRSYLEEPAPRNTAPAVALGAAWASRKFGGDADLLVLPSDHHIRRPDVWARAVARLAGVCRKTGSLGVMGITPTGPETAYGYILGGEPAGRGFRVGRFVEKPDRRKASRLLAGGNATWNSGMFLFPLGVLREEMARHCAGLWEAAEAWLDGDPGPYTSWPKISVDYALMEKSARVAMVPGDFGWSDVGTFPALHALLPKDEAGNAGWGPGLAEGCERSLIVTARAGTLVRGLRDHVHVEGPGGILSVPMAAAGDIREGVEAILRRG